MLAAEKVKPWERLRFDLGGYITDFDSDIQFGLESLGAGINVNVEEALGWIPQPLSSGEVHHIVSPVISDSGGGGGKGTGQREACPAKQVPDAETKGFATCTREDTTGSAPASFSGATFVRHYPWQETIAVVLHAGIVRGEPVNRRSHLDFLFP